MRSTRAVMVVGISLLAVAGANLVAGFTDEPWLSLAAAAVGSIVLIAALLRKRGEAERPATHDPGRGERLVRPVTYGLVGLGLIAVMVAVVVAEGDARGHATFHLLTGFLCLGLFAALAFLWHPLAGGGAATLRGLVLTLLAVAALGSFLESLGGAGYDAANDGHRIEVLTTLHSIALPFGAFLIVAVPLGVITGIVVLVAWATRRGRTVRT